MTKFCGNKGCHCTGWCPTHARIGSPARGEGKEKYRHVAKQVASDLVEAEVPVNDGLEDPCERAVVELEEAEDIEVPQQARGDVIPAPAGGTHRTHHNRVNDRLPRHVLQVVPGIHVSGTRGGVGFLLCNILSRR